MNVSRWIRKLGKPFLRQKPFVYCIQTLCAAASPVKGTQLTHRALVRVCGEDSGTFLQGLVTADVTTLKENRVLYSMLLNAQGRVLYDIFLYHRGNNDQLLECDSQAAADLIRHLKRYALRSKVEITNADSDFKLWALFPSNPGQALPDDYFLDPRLNEFGARLIATASTDAGSVLSLYTASEATIDEYHHHRLKTGLAEGVGEIPVGNCIPLEYNLDLLNGVSFHKGCYLGQELTARTHHTGVVRKRVMPITLSRSPDEEIAIGSKIVSSEGKSLGKLVCHHSDIGLALLRIKESSNTKVFLSNTAHGEELELFPHRPHWWPPDLQF